MAGLAKLRNVLFEDLLGQPEKRGGHGIQQDTRGETIGLETDQA